jgi:hypothetical protein
VAEVTSAWVATPTSWGSTQCAAVTTTLGATSVPVHSELPAGPVMMSATTFGYWPVCPS